MRAARAVHEMGPHVVIAKQGEHGAGMYTPDGFFGLPAYPTADVVDPTGAGDTFAGGFMGYVAAHAGEELTDELLRRAIAYGTALASFNVEAFGTERMQTLTGDEVAERVAELQRVTRFDAAPVPLRRLLRKALTKSLRNRAPARRPYLRTSDPLTNPRKQSKPYHRPCPSLRPHRREPRRGFRRPHHRRDRRGHERAAQRDRLPPRALQGDGRRRPSRPSSWPSAPAPTSAISASGWPARAPAATSSTTPRPRPTACRPSTPRSWPTRTAPSTRAACSSRPARPSSPRITSPTASAPATASAGTSTTTTCSTAPPRCSASPTRPCWCRSGSRRSRASRPASARRAVADVGCGHGISTILMAEAYPQSTFVGFDYHEASIEKARQLAAWPACEDRVRFELATATDFPGRGYDLVACFDALHDMGDPAAAARHIWSALAEDGTWMIVEPSAGDAVEENFHPLGRIRYGFSTLVCTPGSLSQPGRAALGTLAGEERLSEAVRAGGFCQVAARPRRRSTWCSRRARSGSRRRARSRSPGVVAELAAQRRDHDLDDVRAARPLVAPHVAQQRGALHGLALPAAQVRKTCASRGVRPARVRGLLVARAAGGRRARRASRRPTPGPKSMQTVSGTPSSGR